mmetsp:Transcript_18486/g.44505  ORF Transcript_18486/g.44505 Transcript_18486/m.44505 type:complete len:109 (-) Transcript_18486:494-820(-)
MLPAGKREGPLSSTATRKALLVKVINDGGERANFGGEGLSFAQLKLNCLNCERRSISHYRSKPKLNSGAHRTHHLAIPGHLDTNCRSGFKSRNLNRGNYISTLAQSYS